MQVEGIDRTIFTPPGLLREYKVGEATLVLEKSVSSCLLVTEELMRTFNDPHPDWLIWDIINGIKKILQFYLDAGDNKSSVLRGVVTPRVWEWVE